MLRTKIAFCALLIGVTGLLFGFNVPATGAVAEPPCCDCAPADACPCDPQACPDCDACEAPACCSGADCCDPADPCCCVITGGECCLDGTCLCDGCWCCLPLTE